VALAWQLLSKEVTEEFGFVGGFLHPWHGNPNPKTAEYQRIFIAF
jgi:hypothetical protein